MWKMAVKMEREGTDVIGLTRGLAVVPKTVRSL